ncbi:VOC family protein [Saccharopolyspora sp. HNM0983]|uniref:VOC family protein n=1 Tax=Saccharopolyspora montiporae TaxID=2781240 RepID=A0A929B6V5_9PSEU|nr:VOC family protein [Saccharopolyspora sp. HNM0983]MBE9372910.1 VOC family protein [Saccharopolyspora sp. HNM0983]
MSIRRVMPVLHAEAADPADGEFYAALGFEQVMTHGWITTYASPTTPAAQLSIMTADRTAPVNPEVSIEVEDVDAVHDAMRARGAEIVHPLQDEDWGVRRFFVRDPHGRVLNVLSHR